MSGEKKPNYKSAEKLGKELGAPVMVASRVSGWGEFIGGGKGLVKKIYDFFTDTKDGSLFDKKMPVALNHAFGVLGLVVALVSFPLSIYDSVKKFLKIVDTDNKIREKGVSKIHDLDGDTSVGFKIIQFLLSAFRTGAVGALAFATVIGFLSGKVTLSTVLTSTTAQMAASLGFFALGITVVISAVNLVKSIVKWRNVSKLEKTFKENFDKNHLDKKVDFENLVDFLRNEDVKDMRWETLLNRFSEQLKDIQMSDPRFLKVKALFEKHLPRNTFLGMDRGFQKIDLEALENALKGNSVKPEHIGYRKIYLELKDSPELNVMIQFVRESRLELEKNVRHTFVDKNKTVTAKELKEYLDFRDDYWKLKKDLTEMGINPKKDPELARYNISLKEKLSEAYGEVKRCAGELFEDGSLKDVPGYDQSWNNLDEIFDDKANLDEFVRIACQHDRRFNTIFNNYKDIYAEQEIIDKELSKRLKGKEGVDEKSLKDFLEFSQKYADEKKRMIERMGRDPEQLKDLINMVEARKDKLEGTLVGKGISLGLAVVGLVIAAFTGFPLLLLIVMSAVTLVWSLVDKFAPLPWKKWGTEEKRQEPCILSDSQLTKCLNSQEHKTLENNPEHSMENVEKLSKFGQKVESMKYQALMRKEMDSILQNDRKSRDGDEDMTDNEMNIILQDVGNVLSGDSKDDMLTNVDSLIENAQKNQGKKTEVIKTICC